MKGYGQSLTLNHCLLVVVQDDLVGMRKDLESEAKQLQQDRGKQERLATTITNQMQADAQVINSII